MERNGKERMAADEHEAPDAVQNSRWLNGVNRQLRTDADSHATPVRPTDERPAWLQRS